MAARRLLKRSLVLALLLVLVIAAFNYIYTRDSAKTDLDLTLTVLNRGLSGEPEVLDPHNFSSNQAATILRDLGEGLLTFDQRGEVIGGVADSWAVTEDGLTYRFDIRSNAKWSNGDEVTAGQFVYAFRKLADPRKAAKNAPSVSYLLNGPEVIAGEKDPVELGIRAVTDSLLEITLHTPTPHFIQLLAHPSTFPRYDDVRNKDHRKAANRVFNGPFDLVEWIVGSEIRLIKNPNYWNSDNVFFDSVVYHIVEETTELNRFRANELDITANVPSNLFVRVRQEFGSQLKVTPYLGVYYYGFNLKHPVFAKDLDLRRALSLAIDREVLVTRVTRRGEEPAYGWVPPGVANYESQSIDELQLDKSQRELLAQRLYEKSGYSRNNPLKFELRYNQSDVQQRIAVAIQSMWKDVLGAQATLVSEEFKVLLANIEKGEETEIFRLSWTGDYNDAQAFLQVFESENPSNMTAFANQDFDSLMKAASIEIDLTKRSSLLEAAEKLVLAEYAVIPLYFYVSKHLVHNRLDGWSANVLDIHPSQFIRLAVH